jgi:molybdopterin synthase catalytic subunit
MIDILLSDKPLDAKTCLQKVQDDGVGGIVLFEGTVRNQTQGKKVMRLEFEAYEPMAVSEMEKIAHTIFQQWPAHHVCMHHRTGTLAVGEIPVLIAVACPHRKAAFEACQYAIDTLKETVPIWKKEIFEDGEVWVSAHP